MKLPDHKTKIVCTIGPACRSESMLEEMMQRGMTAARLNFAHGTLEERVEEIRRIRSVAGRLGRHCLVFADLPGPKIRLGKLSAEPVFLRKGQEVILSAAGAGSENRLPVDYKKLPQILSPGRLVFINDGFIQLHVEKIDGEDVYCRVAVGGPLLSYKGLNLPGVRLTDDVLSKEDLELADFALGHDIEAVSISFVESGSDIVKMRKFAEARHKSVYIIAKIERAEALKNIDEILIQADAVMIARGDLGVQTPIEQVPGIQKKLIHKANLLGRPVITATQMLVSMTDNVRPTRAEVSDVANAILDGTDAVMLSEESAIGKYPVEAVEMMSKIAASIERESATIRETADLPSLFRKAAASRQTASQDIISLTAVDAAQILKVSYILIPTHHGSVPRLVSRFKPESWIIAFSRTAAVSNFLCLSYGVQPVMVDEALEPLSDEARNFLQKEGLAQNEGRFILVEGGPDPAEGMGRSDAIRILSVR